MRFFLEGRPLTTQAVLLLIVAVPLCAGPARGQDEGIIPDRPDPSGVVIPKGTVQLESGMAWTTANRTRTLDAPESLLRFGVSSKTELRLDVPNYFLGLGRHELRSGFGDLLIGMKQQIVSTASGFNLSIIPALSLPTGAESRSSRRVDPELQIPFSLELENKWLLGAVLTVADPTENARRNLTGESLFYVAREIGRHSEAFIGYIGDLRQRGSPGQLMEIGGTHRLTRHQQVDVFMGIGFSRAAPGLFVAAGYSIRFDAARKK